MKLQLTHYRRKGIYAYLCSVAIEQGQIKRGEFINGTPIESDKSNYHRGKSATVEFDLTKFSGWHEFKEASGHRSKTGFIDIQNGEIVGEVATFSGLIEILAPIDSSLPELEGSAKQIAWAEKIRATAIRSGLPLETAIQVKSAKQWIDDRIHLATYSVK